VKGLSLSSGTPYTRCSMYVSSPLTFMNASARRYQKLKFSFSLLLGNGDSLVDESITVDADACVNGCALIIVLDGIIAFAIGTGGTGMMTGLMLDELDDEFEFALLLDAALDELLRLIRRVR
jgi:hypothetical protein